MTQLSKHHGKDDRVGGPLYDDHVLIPGNSGLRNREKKHFDRLIQANIGKDIIEIEIREEARILLQQINPRTPDIIYREYQANGIQANVLEGIQRITMDPDTFEIQKAEFSLLEYSLLRDFFIAIEKYLKSEMNKRGYSYYINMGLFPGTLRFGREPFEYKVPTKIELVSTVESDALLGIVR